MHEILTGWGKAAKNIAMYEYGYHLAEVSAPFPMIARNVEELPLQYANGVTMWTPETLPSFDTGLPGLYLGIRMAWNPKVEPQAILDEFFSNFYGAAGRPMKDYWQSIDACWAKVPEHAGSGFGHMRRFTPERLAEARRLMDAAVTACETALESRRVKMADASLRQLERFMKMRRDYFSGRFAELETDSRRWTGVHQALADEYAANYAFTKTGWCPQTVAVLYANIFFFNSYADASRIAREYSLLTPALNVWSYAVDREKNGETQGLAADGFRRQDLEEDRRGHRHLGGAGPAGLLRLGLVPQPGGHPADPGRQEGVPLGRRHRRQMQGLRQRPARAVPERQGGRDGRSRRLLPALLVRHHRRRQGWDGQPDQHRRHTVLS